MKGEARWDVEKAKSKAVTSDFKEKEILAK